MTAFLYSPDRVLETYKVEDLQRYAAYCRSVVEDYESRINTIRAEYKVASQLVTRYIMEMRGKLDIKLFKPKADRISSLIRSITRELQYAIDKYVYETKHVARKLAHCVAFYKEVGVALDVFDRKEAYEMKYKDIIAKVVEALDLMAPDETVTVRVTDIMVNENKMRARVLSELDEIIREHLEDLISMLREAEKRK